MTTEVETPNPYQLTILYAMNVTGKHIYAGTVSETEIARRRKANKVARAQRKKNRVRSA